MNGRAVRLRSPSGAWVRGAGGAALVVVAVALGSAWTVGAPRPADPVRAAVPALERALAGTISSPDAPAVAAEPMLSALRTVESRLPPIWALPGLAAGLAAVCVLRRLRGSPAPPAALVLCRVGRSRRGPPLVDLV